MLYLPRFAPIGVLFCGDLFFFVGISSYFIGTYLFLDASERLSPMNRSTHITLIAGASSSGVQWHYGHSPQVTNYGRTVFFQKTIHQCTRHLMSLILHSYKLETARHWTRHHVFSMRPSFSISRGNDFRRHLYVGSDEEVGPNPLRNLSSSHSMTRASTVREWAKDAYWAGGWGSAAATNDWLGSGSREKPCHRCCCSNRYASPRGR